MKLPPEFQFIKGRTGWHRSPTGDWEQLEERALELQNQIPLPVQIFCGHRGDDAGPAIYLIEDVSPIELAKEFETGSHNALDKFETKRVCDELARIFKIAPFRPYFMDAAGYKAKFLEPLTLETAQSIVGILTVGLEGYASEWTGEESEMSEMVETLMRENQIRLWWD